MRGGLPRQRVEVGLDLVQPTPDRPQIEHHRDPDERVGDDQKRRRRQLLGGRQLVDRNELALARRRLHAEREQQLRQEHHDSSSCARYSSSSLICRLARWTRAVTSSADSRMNASELNANGPPIDGLSVGITLVFGWTVRQISTDL